jgi:hypothetical protein
VGLGAGDEDDQDDDVLEGVDAPAQAIPPVWIIEVAEE